MQSTAAASPEEVTGPATNSDYTPSLFRIAERFGLPVALLLLVLWWVRGDVVQPLLDAHFTFIDRVVDGQERHSQEVRELGDKLDTLIQITREK